MGMTATQMAKVAMAVKAAAGPGDLWAGLNRLVSEHPVATGAAVGGGLGAVSNHLLRRYAERRSGAKPTSMLENLLIGAVPGAMAGAGIGQLAHLPGASFTSGEGGNGVTVSSDQARLAESAERLAGGQAAGGVQGGILDAIKSRYALPLAATPGVSGYARVLGRHEAGYTWPAAKPPRGSPVTPTGVNAPKFKPTVGQEVLGPLLRPDVSGSGKYEGLRRTMQDWDKRRGLALLGPADRATKLQQGLEGELLSRQLSRGLGGMSIMSLLQSGIKAQELSRIHAAVDRLREVPA